MKVKDLIEKLQVLPPDMDVVESDYSYDIHEGYVEGHVEVIETNASGRVTKYWDDEDKAKYGPIRKVLRIGRD